MRATADSLFRSSMENRIKAFSFKPRPSDVFIATSSKCGTTLVMQICHQLRTGGHMDFEDVYEVIPWLELSYDIQIDPNDEQIAEPRLFKTHAWHDHIPKGARYIVVLRDPLDASVSFYNFFKDWMFEGDDVTIDDWMKWHVLSRDVPQSILQYPSIFRFYESWLMQRGNPNYLFLFYEDILLDPVKEVKKISSFIGLPEDEERIQTAVRMSSREFMLEHVNKFEENRVRDILATKGPDGAIANWSKGSGAKVAPAGKKRPSVSAEHRAQMDAEWKRVVEPVTGFKSYADMLADQRTQKL
ncbi:hypothetical protein NDN08_001044 [Rhodosorus marinus]|uniref:Sulfotransferase domain-containing protein n=1 Tax=Rhodosorus marinus TaxID=101924 RepID=A0AAV8UVE3_9RHOD|nr:hypothetical protein NDN08_001044 [Rhodosorus marinus]